LIRRHFFLVGALCVLVLMVVAGGLRLAAAKSEFGGQAAQGQGPGGGGGRRGGQGGGGFGAAVTPATVGVRTFIDRIEVLGVAKGRQSVTVTSNNTEIVTGVHFRDGEIVRRGQILVDLQARQEDAAVANARAAVNLAQANYNRWKALDARGFAPKAQLDLMRAQLQQAQAALATARSQRADRAIRAPFSGVVGLSDVAPGSLINPGTPIVSLDDLSVVRVDFDIPDRYLATLRQGLGIQARTDALPGETFSGVIAQFDTRVNEQTRSIRARAEFPNPGGRLRPGMLMRVGIEQGSRQALSVPEAAIQYSGDAPYVYVIARRGGGMVAQQRIVVAGADEDGFVEIKSGLQAGEQIVGDGLNKLQPNQPIRLAGAGGPGGQGARGGPPGGRPGPARP